MNLTPPHRNGLTIGLEVTSYAGSRITTGIQQVISHLYDQLRPFWESKGTFLMPMTCQSSESSNAVTLLPPGRISPRLRSTTLVAPEQCDVIILPDIDNGVDFQRLRKLATIRTVPIVAIVYDILPILDPSLFLEDAKRNFRIWLQQTLSVASAVVVNTEKVGADLRSLGWKLPQSIHVVPLGSRLRHRPPAQPDGDRIRILYVSTIEPRKGHELLLRVFELLLSWGKDVIMTFIGHQGWMVDDLCGEIRNHPEFGSRLRWYPGAGDDVLERVALSSNIGVMPSKGEGFGMFIEEGLSLGLKFIASDIPEFLERAQPNLYFSTLDPVTFATTILRVHDTPWIECQAPRSMSEFSYDFSSAIESIVQRSFLQPFIPRDTRASDDHL